MKRCIDCGIRKHVAAFHLNGSHKDGLSSYCKACDLERCRQRRAGGERPRFRWPIVEVAPRRPPKVGHGCENLCKSCPDMIECRTLAWYKMPVRCEARDTRDMLRKAQGYVRL